MADPWYGPTSSGEMRPTSMNASGSFGASPMRAAFGTTCAAVTGSEDTSKTIEHIVKRSMRRRGCEARASCYDPAAGLAYSLGHRSERNDHAAFGPAWQNAPDRPEPTR